MIAGRKGALRATATRWTVTAADAAERRPVATACIVLGALVLATFWPSLVGGRTLLPVDTLYGLWPLDVLPHEGLNSAHNTLLSDPPLQFAAWLHLARPPMRALDIPQWDPYSFGGVPLLANAQAALFYPLNVAFWILPFKYAFGVAAAAKLFVAGLGTFLLARELGLRLLPGLLAATTYGFAPFLIVWLSHPHVNVYCVLPLVLFALERTLRTARAWPAIGLAAATAFALTGGHPGSDLHVVLCAAVYAAVRLALLSEPWRARMRGLGLAAAGGALGVGVAAVALLPAAALVPGSNGQQARAGGGVWLPPSSLKTLLFPDWWGRPSSVQVPGGPLNFNERLLYVGVITLALAALALISRARWREKGGIVAIGVLGLGVALGVPGIHTAVVHLPGLDSATNVRLIGAWSLAAAVMAAFGLQHLLDMERAWRRLGYVLAAFGVVVVYTLARVQPTLHELHTTLRHFLTGQTYAVLTRTLPLIAIAWCVLFLLVLALAFAVRGRVGVTVLAALIVVGSIVDLAHFRDGYQPQVPSNLVPPVATPLVTDLQARLGNDRMTGIGSILPPEEATYYRLRDIRGYNPPEPSLRLKSFLSLAGEFTTDFYSMPTLTPMAPRIFDLLDVRYVTTPPDVLLPGVRYRTIYDAPDGRIYVNPDAVGRAFVPSSVSIAHSEDEALSRVTSTSFVPRRDAVVEWHGAGPAPTAAIGNVGLVKDGGDSVQLDARLSRGGLVVSADPWHAGWSVQVDGHDAHGVIVDGALRGVVVPAGRHTIVWSYRTPYLRLALIITLLSLAALVAWAAALRVRRHAAPRGSPAQGMYSRGALGTL
jgi:hypothetical protein